MKSQVAIILSSSEEKNFPAELREVGRQRLPEAS
jgi:hypothetical protein